MEIGIKPLAAASAAMCIKDTDSTYIRWESTEGAIDGPDSPCDNRMSIYILLGTNIHRQRIIKMGEEKWRVINPGDPAIEIINETKYLTREELEYELVIDLSTQTALVVYHPVTNELEILKDQVEDLFHALWDINNNYNMQLIFIYPNSDQGSNIIIEKIEKYTSDNTKSFAYKSMSHLTYLSLLNYISLLIGNSSSGVIEAPSFKLPVINIGNRQNGRLKAQNIIDCSCTKESIIDAVNTALFDDKYLEDLKSIKNPYEAKNTSQIITKILEDTIIDEKFINKKIGSLIDQNAEAQGYLH